MFTWWYSDCTSNKMWEKFDEFKRFCYSFDAQLRIKLALFDCFKTNIIMFFLTNYHHLITEAVFYKFFKSIYVYKSNAIGFFHYIARAAIPSHVFNYASNFWAEDNNQLMWFWLYNISEKLQFRYSYCCIYSWFIEYNLLRQRWTWRKLLLGLYF